MAYITEQELRVREVEAKEKLATAFMLLAESSMRLMNIVEREIEEEKRRRCC